MRIVIAGATGLIGKALIIQLRGDYEIIALSRNPQKAQSILGSDIKIIEWQAGNPDKWEQYIDGAKAIVNLAGESIATGQWTKAKRQRILQSRLKTTEAVVQAIKRARNRPEVLIQASAIGFYGFDCKEPVDESTEAGSGFLTDVCVKWEHQAWPVEGVGTRLVIIRSGVVLSRQGGALPRLIMPFKFFIGACPGSGRQLVSWITIDDEVAAIRYLIENPKLSGAFNLTAPNPATMKELCKTIGRILKKPCWLSIPLLALRMGFGKMAEETMLASQDVRPERLLKAGFKFAYPEIVAAIEHILAK